ncbi:hypothetical protein EXIGLDRAFT_737560 [Exidia glandulosa HHB12029]|uniref:F-box domain-containing protein n=1 Tax=Exidia glandulosa HHB12029 TaxID=1314781 RepID=A0A165IWM2_EXIGL|nr:hypothetical protein EXIGLDRAFT_737560 [Exidia glandulosa HHB12029]
MSLVLPDALMCELDVCVRRIAKHVQDSQDQSKLDELRHALSREVAVIVSNVICTRNAERAKDTVLTPELWCMIWRELPFASRITVSHVCRSWRATALSFPTLWNDVKIVYSDEDAYSDLPLPVQLQALKTLLSRTASTPVRLHLAVLATEPLEDKLVHINTQLEQHALHIRALRLQVQKDSDLLSAIRDVLPSMSSLRLARFETNDWDASVTSILHLDGGCALGALRVLELDGIIFDKRIPVALAHVDEVSYTVTENPLTPAHLDNLLASCPRIKRLHLDIQAGWWNENNACELPDDLAPELDALTLTVFSAGDLRDIKVLRYLRYETRRVVAFRFKYHAHLPLGRRFVEFVGRGPLHVVVGRGSGMRVSDSEGQVREVVMRQGTMSDDAISTLIADLAPTIESLVTDTSFPFHPNVAFPTLSRLTLRFARPSELLACTQLFTLPALQTLRLELVDATSRAPCRANGSHRVDVESVLALLPHDRQLGVLQLGQVRFRKSEDRSGLVELRSRVGALESLPFDEHPDNIVGQLGVGNLWSDGDGRA